MAPKQKLRFFAASPTACPLRGSWSTHAWYAYLHGAFQIEGVLRGKEREVEKVQAAVDGLKAAQLALELRHEQVRRYGVWLGQFRLVVHVL